MNYFDDPARFGERQYWDGGIAGLNNPVLAAVVEAIAYGKARSEFGVLSIGTGNTFLPTKGPYFVARVEAGIGGDRHHRKHQESGFGRVGRSTGHRQFRYAPDAGRYIARESERASG